MKSRRIKSQDVDERTSGEGEKEVLQTDESNHEEEEEEEEEEEKRQVSQESEDEDSPRPDTKAPSRRI